MRITIIYDYALYYVHIYTGANGQMEVVPLTPGLRPEQRFAPLLEG